MLVSISRGSDISLTNPIHCNKNVVNINILKINKNGSCVTKMYNPHCEGSRYLSFLYVHHLVFWEYEKHEPWVREAESQEWELRDSCIQPPSLKPTSDSGSFLTSQSFGFSYPKNGSTNQKAQ